MLRFPPKSPVAKYLCCRDVAPKVPHFRGLAFSIFWEKKKEKGYILCQHVGKSSTTADCGSSFWRAHGVVDFRDTYIGYLAHNTLKTPITLCVYFFVYRRAETSAPRSYTPHDGSANDARKPPSPPICSGKTNSPSQNQTQRTHGRPLGEGE